MGQKLYPPMLNGVLPAFSKDEDNDITEVKITVPFTMNKTVNRDDIDGFALMIKTVSTGQLIAAPTLILYSMTEFRHE